MSDDKQQQEKPADAWGQPVSEERQADLGVMLEVWNADHGGFKGPFDGARLTGADASWLAERSGRTGVGSVPNLHLETLYVNTSRGSPASQPRQCDAAPSVAIS
jgi:hypothetical protein